MTNISISETGFGPLDNELSQVAKNLFDTQIVQTLTQDDIGKYLVIDIQTGHWELDKDDYQASIRAYRKNPGARSRISVRVGFRTAMNAWVLTPNKESTT